jgi:hypothetical protein
MLPVSAALEPAPTVAPGEVPVEPTPPEAVEWLVDELAKPEYEAARPTPFDLLVQAIVDWFSSLTTGPIAAPPAVIAIIIAVVVVVIVVVLLLVFGVPRRNRRSAVAGAMFGDDDRRSAARLRADADAAARRGDWVTAIADRFRALARAAADCEVVTVLPGTTAREFAASAALAFPGEAQSLASAAIAFDSVRYLSAPGDEASARALADLDDRITASTPVLETAAPIAPAGRVG